jgi:SPP1 gp7 family putative phage head morphogenesis protein
MNDENVVEVKNVIQDLINKFMEIFHIRLHEEVVGRVLGESYREGMEEMEVKFDMNFFEHREQINFLKKYTFDNIKEMNEETANRLRKELSQALMNGESIDLIKERVEKVMDISVERARMIARTESNRAENMGRMDAVKQSGLKVTKYVDATLDARTSDICRHMDKAYGASKQSIELDGKFEYEGKVFDGPPFHPNCRTVLMFEQHKLTKEELQ